MYAHENKGLTQVLSGQAGWGSPVTGCELSMRRGRLDVLQEHFVPDGSQSGHGMTVLVRIGACRRRSDRWCAGTKSKQGWKPYVKEIVLT
jgi:hypothetical protein